MLPPTHTLPPTPTQHNPITSFCDKDVEKLCIKENMWDNLPLGVARSCLMGSVFVTGGGGGGGNVSFELVCKHVVEWWSGVFAYNIF